MKLPSPFRNNIISKDVRFGAAWLGLCLALLFHVFDETVNNFLAFYNPLIDAMRSRVRWFSIPTFTFEVWLSGLIKRTDIATRTAHRVDQRD